MAMTTLKFTFLFAFMLRGITCVHLRIQPSGRAVVVPGHNISILCQAGVPITHCRIKLPHREAVLNLNPTLPSKGTFIYHGKGLQVGDCGVTLFGVTYLLSGTVVCAVNTKLEKEESTASLQLVVAKGPTSVELRGVKGDHRQGETITASCVVRGSNPPANVTWFLDNVVITEGVSQPMIRDDTTTQNLTRVLRREDNNRELRCDVDHVAMRQRDMFSTNRLSVLCAPTDFKKAMEPSDFITGRPGTVSVTLTANPEPSFRWLFGSNVVESGSTDSSGRFEAKSAVSIGDDRWWAALRIDEIMPRDHGLYLLEAKNTVEEAKYYFIVKKSETPRGLQSSTSLAIAVSVVAVICCTLLVIAIVAVIKARREHSLLEHMSLSSGSGFLVDNNLQPTNVFNPLPVEENGDELVESCHELEEEEDRF